MNASSPDHDLPAGMTCATVVLSLALTGWIVVEPAGAASDPTPATSQPTRPDTGLDGPALGGQAVGGQAVGGQAVGGQALGGPGLVVARPADVPSPPAFAATSWVLADLSTGQVLAARGAHRRGLPASTLKTLTALTALPLVDPDAQVTAQASDIVEGSQVGLMPGSRYTVRQLLQGALLASGNDAATALARVAGGAAGVDGHVARMQAEASALGAQDTVVRNPTGLDAAGQVTSAYDLALIARAAMARADLRALVATRKVAFPGKESARGRRPTYQIQNHNRLLSNYPGAVGVKNGFTDRARWTSIGAVTRGGHTYLLTALHRGGGSWRADAAMYDWAVRYGGRVRPVGRLVDRGETAASQPAPGGRLAGGLAAGGVPSPPSSGSDRLRTAVGVVAVLAAICAGLLFFLQLRVRRRRSRALTASYRC